MVLEMNILCPRCESIHDARQSQVMRRDQTDGSTFDQAPNDGLRANGSVVRVRAVQDFVQKKQNRQLAGRQFHRVV
ncbi:hypothetical protein D3C83_25140 [compost metagenome]